MGDVEDMIGQLEEDDEEEEPAPVKEEEKQEDEGAFGLDLDQAWSSPDREEE